MKTYSKMILSDLTAIQYFENVPASKYFKIYTAEDVVSTGMCITHFENANEESEAEFQADENIDALMEFMPQANQINHEGMIFSFDEPMKLNFYIKNVKTPFKVFVDVDVEEA